MKDSDEIRVSVVMANHNGAAHIAAAVRSVFRQSEKSLELVISDDGSTDDSLSRAKAAADGDPRLVVLENAAQTGPAGARNRALAVARGRWIAIVDNDDLIEPRRLQRLLDAAERDSADIVADNLLTFYDGASKAPHAHVRGLRGPRWITATAYAESNFLFGAGAALGYLKPVFRRAAALAYDESLTIAEDSDLVLRMLHGGARMRLYPELGYFYRKHASSISHRLNAASIDAMLAATARMDAGGDIGLGHALAHHREKLLDARGFTDLIDALKAGNAGGALKAAMRRPGALALLREPIKARIFPAKPDLPRAGVKRVALLSRQRIVGATNGSSAYVLAIAKALRDAGYAVDYIGASPKIFGRWAAMRLRPETHIFASYHVRGGMRIGNLLVARDPRLWIASAVAIANKALSAVGVRTRLSRPAEYAQAAAMTPADQVFVARHAAGASAVLCDYCFLTPLASYALAEAPVVTIMHDLMSARVADTATEQTADAVAMLSAAAEFDLLGLSDAVIAIQRTEAAIVATALPKVRVLLTPHGSETVSAAQPGLDDTLLFVGSNTPPNVVGLEWFFRDIWPAIRTARPSANLQVAGSVARGLTTIPQGVTALGVVDDLAPLYRDAGIVISPLYTGSGLKIKLIEALAAGKAVVGTPVTVQGVETLTAGVIALAGDPPTFAAAVIALLDQPEQRRALGHAALTCAETHFSTAASFAALTAFLRGDNAAASRNALPETAPASQ